MVSVGIDTGGTFTDGFFTKDGRVEIAKVETTPHDLTICLMDCLKAGSTRLGYGSLSDMLKETELIRFSTTIATNALIEKKGPKLGILVTKGYEKNLYGKQSHNPILDYLIPHEMVRGIDESTQEDGTVTKVPDPSEVRNAVKELLLAGARMIVVSYLSAAHTPVNEATTKDIAQQDFPLHYLGYVPILLSSDVSSTSDPLKRTNTTIINAFIHQTLVRDLYKVEDDLRNAGFERPLLIGHSDGGVARVAKTRAIDTYNSGPAAGLYGSSYMSRTYNLKRVLTMDIGGTSTDLSVIRNDRWTYDPASKIEGLPVDLPLLKIDTFGTGGGSIVRVNGEKLSVGPESTGSVPGPACFGLGGTEATTTDAYLVLGLVDPKYFLGGRKKLLRENAESAIKRSAADPLGINVELAAWRIVEAVENQIVARCKALLNEEGVNAAKATLFAFGGSGGMHGCGVAEGLGCKKVLAFMYNPAFCAFGMTTLDVVHRYDLRLRLPLKAGEGLGKPTKEFNDAVTVLINRAYRDMRGEGFPKRVVRLSLALTLTDSKQKQSTDITYAKALLTERDLKALRDTAAKTLRDHREMILQNIRLRARAPVRKHTLPAYKIGKRRAKPVGTRTMFTCGKASSVPFYRSLSLDPGSKIRGPALVEGEYTNVFIREGWEYTLDRTLNGIMERM